MAKAQPAGKNEAGAFVFATVGHMLIFRSLGAADVHIFKSIDENCIFVDRHRHGIGPLSGDGSCGLRPRPRPSPAEGARKVAVLVNIDKTNQKMTVFLDGVEAYEWPVSTGRAGYSTPSGTYTATSMNEIWYSKQWDNAPMPHAVFFMKDGHAIHGSFDVKNLGKPVSHGCVRISPKNAATLYALVKGNGLENTQVVVAGVSPGGEYGVAGGQTSPRSGFFGSLFTQ